MCLKTKSIKQLMNSIKIITSFVLITLIHFNLSAQEDEVKSEIKISGYIDTYYTYDYNKPSNHDRQYTNMAARHDEFNINHAYIMGEYEDSKFRGVLGLQTGTYVDFNYAAEPSDASKLIYKAYAGVKLSEKVWVDAGMFGGHTGYEAVESINNEIYSRALATEYTPYYETGVRLTAELSEKITLTGVILNGWQNIAETNDTKSFGMNINFKASEDLELNYGNYFGDEGNGFIGSRYRYFHHAYVRYQFSDKFHSMLSMDFGSQEQSVGKENFYFLTFISQYKISDKVSLAMRFEKVDDEFQILLPTSPASFGGFVGEVYTFNINYHINENAMFRVEARFFDTDNDIFTEGDVVESNNEVLSTSLAIKF